MLRVGERMRGGVRECSQRPGLAEPILPQATVPTLLHAETLWALTLPARYSDPPMQREVMEGADNWGVGEQGDQ